MTDDQICQEIINESIQKYKNEAGDTGDPRDCPCPYNYEKNGRACGNNSAYKKRGGASPICYIQDINQDMINEYKNKNMNETQENTRTSDKYSSNGAIKIYPAYPGPPVYPPIYSLPIVSAPSNNS